MRSPSIGLTSFVESFVIGIELKPSYYRQSIKNVQVAYDGARDASQIAFSFAAEKPLDEVMDERYGCAPRPSPLRRNVASGKGRA